MPMAISMAPLIRTPSCILRELSFSSGAMFAEGRTKRQNSPNTASITQRSQPSGRNPRSLFMTGHATGGMTPAANIVSHFRADEYFP